MSFNLTTLENWITETEADVLNVISKIKTEVAVIESEIASALHWVASNTPTIAADIEEVLSLVGAFGVAGDPVVATAIKAANVAVTALNAYAAAANSGQNLPQAVVNGYVAVKQAQAAAATAKAIAVSAPTP